MEEKLQKRDAIWKSRLDMRQEKEAEAAGGVAEAEMYCRLCSRFW